MRRGTSVVLLCLALLCPVGYGTAVADEQPLYLNPEEPIEARARDLVSRMTLEEKISQMVHDAAAIPRLGVPAYDWWNECLHGVGRAGRATVFPQAIGLGATFDVDLMHRVGTAISDEARAKHHTSARAGRRDRYRGLTFWTPNVNIFRDPRWGRGQETYGEDPFLMAEMATAFVRGLQGDHPRYLKVAAGAKHFAVHSGPEGERHTFDAVASPKDMEETYFPAFEALVEAGVETVMCAYNRVNGEVACGSDFLLVETLRGRWGFEGHVVSDCWAISDFDAYHKVTADNVESAALALKKGTNLNCGNSYPKLGEAVERGLVTEAEIEESLVTLMKTRFKLGLFDPEGLNPYASIEVDVVGSPEHRRLSREAAVKSLVLLKNADGLLPLDKNLKKVYVTGPLAADAAVLLGNYNGVSGDLATVLEGVTAKVGPATMVSYRQGSLLDRANVNPIDWYSGVAEDADVTLAVMGINNLLEGEEGAAIASPGKGDRFDLGLPENQLDFLRNIREKAPKLVVVLFGGSPMTISEVHDLADAVLLAWYPGEEGGRAVADVLFGDAAPSGRLPITFPESLEQLPPYEDYSMAGRTYRYMTEEPLYPFGFGLGYTTFEYGSLELSPAEVAPGEDVAVRVEVTNRGKSAGEEVVQLYVSDLEASVAVPRASLAGFRRVYLEPGESRTVGFTLTPRALELVDDRGERVLEPGTFAVTVGGASPGGRSLALGASKPARAELSVQAPNPVHQVTEPAAGMVSSAHPLATQAGLDVLARGGNAFDAAVAVAATLNVVEPSMSGLGGYGTILVYDAEKRETRFLNASGRIPRGVDSDVFRPPTPGYEENRTGPKAVSTPGNAMAWEALWTVYGRLPREEIFAPAIRAAEDGFELSPRMARFIEMAFDDFPAHAKAFYGKDGEPLAAGERLVQKDLGRTLRAVAEDGPGVIHGGEIGRAVDRAMRESGSFLRLSDLEENEAEWYAPISIDYRGYEVLTASPPATAFPSLLRLGLMSRFDVAALGHNTVAYLHRFAEVTKHAFWCRLAYAGDPERTPPPLDRLLSAGYWQEQAGLLGTERATTFEPPVEPAAEGMNTTHFVVADGLGNVVSATQTLGNLFGSRIMVEGTGIWLNNSLAYCTFEPAGNPMDAHAGHHKLSGDCPTIVLRDGRPWVALGTPGGHTIGQTVPQMVMNLIDFGMDLESAVAAPRVSFVEPDLLAVEESVAVDVRAGLEALGHKLRVVEALGNAHALAIEYGADGKPSRFEGAADPRGEGVARGLPRTE